MKSSHLPSTENGTRSQVKELADIFRGRIVDVAMSHVMIELSGQERKIDSFIDMMRPFGIIELVRTGRIALLRTSEIAPAVESEEGSGAPADEPPPEAVV